MKSLCNRRVTGWNPDTLKEIVRFVHEVHPVFAVTLTTFLHMLCGGNDDNMPTFNLFRAHLKCFLILVLIILEVSYNVLNRKYFVNFSFINFIKVYFILFLLIYFIKVYLILFLITYLFYLLFFMHHFSCIYWLFWAMRPWNWKAFEMNFEKVKSWDGIIISPT